MLEEIAVPDYGIDEIIANDPLTSRAADASPLAGEAKNNQSGLRR